MLLLGFCKYHIMAELVEVTIMKNRQASFSKEMVREVIDNITSRRTINRVDQKIFMSALLSKGNLSLEDQTMIEKIYQGLQSGLIKVVD